MPAGTPSSAAISSPERSPWATSPTWPWLRAWIPSTSPDARKLWKTWSTVTSKPAIAGIEWKESRPALLFFCRFFSAGGVDSRAGDSGSRFRFGPELGPFFQVADNGGHDEKGRPQAHAQAHERGPAQ